MHAGIVFAHHCYVLARPLQSLILNNAGPTTRRIKTRDERRTTMEKETIAKIVEEGKKLVEKRSWLSKGYVDLIVAINLELAKIPDMDEERIEYTMKEWTYYSNRQQADLDRKITVDLIFKNDAKIEVMLGKQTDSFSGDFEWDELTDPAISNIRLFAEKLQEIFDFFEKEILKRNLDNQVAIDTISSLLAKLQ